MEPTSSLYSRPKINLNNGGVYRLEEMVAYSTSVLFFVFEELK
jgi:hypothetical protein